MRKIADFYQSTNIKIKIYIVREMGLESSALFKFACGSMFLGMILGAKFGHAGKLKD